MSDATRLLLLIARGEVLLKKSVIAGKRLLLRDASGSAVLLVLGRFTGRVVPSANAVFGCFLPFFL